MTTVRLLAERERTAELARMLSGSRITEASLRHASDLIKTGKS
jgi:DNA repair ATPase RecN